MPLKNNNLDEKLSLDVSQVFVNLISEGNKLLASGRVSDAAAVFNLAEVEMKDFIHKQIRLMSQQ